MKAILIRGLIAAVLVAICWSAFTKESYWRPPFDETLAKSILEAPEIPYFCEVDDLQKEFARPSLADAVRGVEVTRVAPTVDFFQSPLQPVEEILLNLDDEAMPSLPKMAIPEISERFYQYHDPCKPPLTLTGEPDWDTPVDPSDSLHQCFSFSVGFGR